MRVALIRNLHEGQNISMKLLGDRLEHSLRDRVEVLNVRPWWPDVLSPDHATGKLVGYVSRYLLYPTAVAKIDADVYHIVDHAYAQVATTLPRERTICQCHDLMLLKLQRGDFGKRPVPKVAATFFRLAVAHLRRVGTVLTISQATKETLIEMLGVDERRIHVVYPPLDRLYRPRPVTIDRDALRRSLSLDSRPVLLHVGNNWFYKNIDGLLRGFAIARQQSREDLVLVKAGKGLTPEQRALAATLGVLDHIVEPGALTDTELQQYYWAADALVFPSIWEGFGWPPVEAMASGLPVVCGRAGALVEAAGSAAEMVDPHSPEDIARGITCVLDGTAYRAELVRRGFINARRFAADDYADKIYDLYCDVAGVPRSQTVCAE